MRAILTYHSVDPSGSAISIAAAEFRRHVEWLGSGRVRVASLESLLAADAGNDTVALTFDDGFANFAAEAWPPLRERGWPVTLFVVSDHVGGTNAWGGRAPASVPALPLLDWDSLGRLAEDGVTLGAHSRTHPDLTQQSDAALADELAGSADAIAARTGRRPASFAFPYGATDDRVETAAAARFALAVTTELRPLGPAERPHALPRLDTFYLRDGTRLALWGSRAFRRWLAFRHGLRRMRAALARAGSPA